MSEKRRGLGRGLGALIPSGPTTVTGRPGDRPVDVFFPERQDEEPTEAVVADPGVSVGTTEASVTASERTEAATTAGGSALPAAREGGRATMPSVAPQARSTQDSPVFPAPAPADPLGDPSYSGFGSSALDGATPLEPTQLEPTQLEPTQLEPTQLEPTPLEPVASAPRYEESGPSSELVPVPGARFAEIPVTSIRPNPKQPRTVFDEEALAELVHSISEIGVLQPIVVRPATDGGEHEFELIMGERRWRATREAGLDVIPAIIRETEEDALLRDALLENLHRSNLNALEEAAAYQQLLDDFGCTHEELATRIGRSRPQISNTIRLLRLPPAVQRRVAAGVLSAGHARALLGLDDTEAMDKLAQRIIAEGLSVRATEEAVSLSDSSPAAAPRKRPRAGGQHAELDDLASRLGDRLDTRVKIALGSSKGRLQIEFASVEDLNRILELLTPDERGAFQTSGS